jgi:hypothetical protein
VQLLAKQVKDAELKLEKAKKVLDKQHRRYTLSYIQDYLFLPDPWQSMDE